MLKTKNIAVINSADKKSYKVYPYDRFNLQFSESDPVEELTKTNQKQLVKVNGEVWKGTTPSNYVTKDFSQENVAKMAQDAVNHLVDVWGQTDTYKDVPADVKATIVMLGVLDYGNDLMNRAVIQSKARQADAEPAVIRAKLIKGMIAEAANNGKILTEAQAEKRLVRLAELEAEEELTATA